MVPKEDSLGSSSQRRHHLRYVTHRGIGEGDSEFHKRDSKLGQSDPDLGQGDADFS
jgi:hypothetical protein